LSCAEPRSEYDAFADNVKKLLEKGALPANTIIESLKLNLTAATLVKKIRPLDFVEVVKIKNKNCYQLKNNNYIPNFNLQF